jgi:hypothetical protein
MTMNREKLEELLYQSAETELGGVEVYETAVECARNPDLRKEWMKYLKQTRRHVEITQELLDVFGLHRDKETPGRAVVRSIGQSLVAAMLMAEDSGDATAAEGVAAECVVLAETKDHLNWKLLSECTGELSGPERRALSRAVEEVEEEEDEHLHHSAGWARELWLEGLGLGGVLPPPEEKKDVRSAIGAARAAKARGSSRRSRPKSRTGAKAKTRRGRVSRTPQSRGRKSSRSR